MIVKDKKVTVVGLARSGAGAAKLLSQLGAAVTVTDTRPASERQICSGLDSSVARSGHRRSFYEG
jgi:UDP-N-acetylmuramoylalanine--D-glutamate ligase